MRSFLLLAVLSFVAQLVWATTYSAQPLSAEDAQRKGINIVVSRNSDSNTSYSIAVNPEGFSRCRISYVSISTRDESGNIVRYQNPNRLGIGYYFHVDESLIANSSAELVCEARGANRPGDRYTIDLSGYVDAN